MIAPHLRYAAGYPFASFALSAVILAFQFPAQEDMTAKVVSIGDGDTLTAQQSNRKVTIRLSWHSRSVWAKNNAKAES